MINLVVNLFIVSVNSSAIHQLITQNSTFSHTIHITIRNEGCFTEFCTRFQDRSIDIRVMMCEVLSILSLSISSLLKTLSLVNHLLSLFSYLFYKNVLKILNGK